MPDRDVILLAEDRDDDVLLVRQAFDQAGIRNPLYVVHNGQEAISYLKGEGPFASREEFPLPSLLLLDLKMPGVDGFEVLEWIRQQPGLSSLRVVVLTSSDQMKDVNRAYQAGANSFLVKPHDFENLIALSRTILTFWVNQSKAPDISRVPREARKH